MSQNESHTNGQGVSKEEAKTTARPCLTLGEKEDPLEASEVERAASWALGIHQHYEAQEVHLTVAGKHR